MASLVKPMMGRSGTKRGSHGSDLAGDIAHDFRRKIGVRMRELRERAGLTQADVAKRLGTWNTNISNYECGKGTVSPEHLEELAELFGEDRAKLGKFVLEFTNPWVYRLIFGSKEDSLSAERGVIPERVVRRGDVHND